MAFLFRWQREINVLMIFNALILTIFTIVYVVLDQYNFLLLTIVLLTLLSSTTLFFLIQLNSRNSIQKLVLFGLYYLFVYGYLGLNNNWIAICCGLSFVLLSVATYKELDYIPPLDRTHKINTQHFRPIKDYPDFIMRYIQREKIYSELAVFSATITLAPIILGWFALNHLLVDNINIVHQLWTLLIIEMCSLLGVGFSELIKLHAYFFIKNTFNKYTFSCWYLIISLILCSFFVIIPGLTLNYFIGISFLEFPFTFVELCGILLLSMYVSLFFPATRKKIPLLAISTITILWMLIKQFILEKSNFMPLLIFASFTVLISLLFLAIIIELGKLNKGLTVEYER